MIANDTELPRMYEIIQTMINELGDEITDAAIAASHTDQGGAGLVVDDRGESDREILVRACAIILKRRAEVTTQERSRQSLDEPGLRLVAATAR